jgi:hypothetical protein
MTLVGTREPLRHVLCCYINDTEILTKEDTLILGCMKFHKHDLNLKLQYGLKFHNTVYPYFDFSFKVDEKFYYPRE